MVDRSDTIAIDRPVEDVFAYVTDVTNDPAWHTDVLEARKVSEGPIGVGTVWHSKFRPSMGISEGEMRVVTFEPNRRQVMQGDVGPMHPTLTYELEPVDGGTRFTRHVQISVTGWMKIMSPMIGMMLPKQNRGFLANLKRVMEGRSA
ncbi:MAG TPA: SRPBCC family protein [Actinomycetota bacterium]|nr:SRPBCC family protein [Actinomycetota bacterium]